MSTKWRILTAVVVCWIAATLLLSDGKRYCRDGTTTSSSGRGTCSWHGGRGTQRELKYLDRAFLLILASWSYYFFIRGPQPWKTGTTRQEQPRQMIPKIDQAHPRVQGHLRFLPLPADTTPPPKCPVCMSSLRLRAASKGRHKGEQFWGCSRYPKCKVLVPCSPAKTNTAPDPQHRNDA